MDIKQLIASTIETVIKIVLVIFLVRFVYGAALKAYDYGYRVFAEEPVSAGEGRTISIYVQDGDSVKDIGQNLEEKGLIRDANLFFVQELLSEHHGKINPGIYDLSTSMTADDMLAVMAAELEEEDGEDAGGAAPSDAADGPEADGESQTGDGETPDDTQEPEWDSDINGNEPAEE